MFRDLDSVADGATVAAAVDGHWFVGERHNRGIDWGNGGSLLLGSREGDAEEPGPERILLKADVGRGFLLESGLWA